eukprot:scaffold7204_cov102-Isochrysis_galbana.AAC.8
MGRDDTDFASTTIYHDGRVLQFLLAFKRVKCEAENAWGLVFSWAVKQAVRVLTMIWSRGVSSASSAYSSGRGKPSRRGPLIN